MVRRSPASGGASAGDRRRALLAVVVLCGCGGRSGLASEDEEGAAKEEPAVCVPAAGGGEPDDSDGPVALAVTGWGAVGIALDEEFVYWTDLSEDTVLRVPKRGGQVTAMAQGQARAGGVVQRSGAVYWAVVAPGDGSGEGRVMRMGVDCTLPEIIYRVPHAWPGSLAVDEAEVYAAALSSSFIWKGRISGGEPEIVAEGEGGPNALIIDDRHLYWASWDADRIRRMDLLTGHILTLASGGDNATDLVISGGHLYWTNTYGRAIMTVPTDGGSPKKTLADEQAVPVGIGLDETHLYWANSADGTIARMPKAGGTVETIAEGQNRPTALAVDTEFVYWVNSGPSAPGGVVRLRKP